MHSHSGGRYSGRRGSRLSDKSNREATAGSREHRSAERFRNLVDCASDAIFTILPDGTIDFVNLAAARIAGADAAEMLGEHFDRFVHPEDLPRAFGAFGDALSGLQSPPIDLRVVQPDGTVVVVEATALPERPNDSVVGVFGIARDVTARRAAEEELRRRERQLAETQRLAHLGNWELDLTTGELAWSEEMYRIYGVEASAFLPTFERYLKLVHPDDRNRILEHRESVVEGAEAETEFRIVRSDGSIRNIHGRMTLSTADGGHRKLFGASQDVTELRRIELELRRREQQLAVAQTIAHAGSYDVDYETGDVTWSDETYQQLGYSKDVRPSLQAFAALIHPDDRERTLRAFREAFEGRRPYAQDYRIVRPDGEARTLHSEGFPVFDAEGRVRKYVGVAQDITARLAMETAAAESRLRLQAIFDNVLDAILVLDDDGRCVDANPAACRLIGASRESLLRQSIAACIPGLHAVKSGTASSGELTSPLNDGLLHEIEYRAVAGVAPGLDLLIVRDIGDRKRAEREIARNHARLRALARRMTERQENERQLIARELHDEVAQMMTAVMLGLQSVRNITGDRTVLDKIEESAKIVESSLQWARGLSFELRPAILDDLGLVAALRWYVDRQRGRADCDLVFKAQEISESVAAPLRMACFRVAQEAIANVVRHANAHRVDVELIGGAAAITLRVADDGDGFDVDAAVSSPDHGLGLLGMQERVLLLGGEFRIRSQRGGGTEVKAMFPLPREKQKGPA